MTPVGVSETIRAAVLRGGEDGEIAVGIGDCEFVLGGLEGDAALLEFCGRRAEVRYSQKDSFSFGVPPRLETSAASGWWAATTAFEPR
jgi:hypothetical protein